jgi:hypothetical protein
MCTDKHKATTQHWEYGEKHTQTQRDGKEEQPFPRFDWDM